MEQLMNELHFAPIISTVVYSLLGIVVFLVGVILIDKLTPYSVQKEIGEDQNIALGIIVGAMMIALAIIIAAAIR